MSGDSSGSASSSGLDPTAWTPATATDAALGAAVDLDAGDGHRYLAEYRGVDEHGRPQVRWSVAVIETKVPYARRPTRGLLDTAEQCAERRYAAVFQPLNPDDPNAQLGAPDAPDDDPVHPVGVTTWWSAYLSEDEAEALRAADNVLHVTYQTRFEAI